MQYVTVSEEQKLALLREQDLGEIEWRSLDQKAWCMFCNKQFTGKDVRVHRDGHDFFLECGTPDCDGSILEWAARPWWRSSKARQRA